jgi:hypothetical protein
MKKNLIQSVAFALAFIPCLVVAQGNLIVNGGFDIDSSGWTLTNVAGNGGAGPGDKGNPGGMISLKSVTPSPATDPTISQTVNSLTPGIVYVVSGDYENMTQIHGGLVSFGVAIDSVLFFQTSAPFDFNWHTFSFDYTATSSSALLSIAAEMNGTSVYYGIDNIAMYAVPEPSAGCLLFLSSGLLIFVRKAGHEIMRRRKFISVKCMSISKQ